MREIIYRAKRKDNNEWIYGYYLHQTNFYGEDCNKHYIINGNEHNSYDNVCEHYIIDEKTLGQYTGLTDKNGNKIFEGDIVMHERYGECRVLFLQQECGYVYATEYSDYRIGHRTNGGLYEVDYNAIVIDNIHDKE